MIHVQITKNNNEYVKLYVNGHAGFASFGKDIVCSAVSILVINTINSIEQFCEDDFQCISDERSGLIDVTFTSDNSEECRLLMNSLCLGLTNIQTEYAKYLTLQIEEV